MALVATTYEPPGLMAGTATSCATVSRRAWRVARRETPTRSPTKSPTRWPIANSEAWVFDEPNLDDFPPAAADDFFAPSTPPSAVGSSCETTPASEKSSGKRARRA